MLMMAVAAILCLAGCSKKSDGNTVVGEWHLTDISPVTKSEEPYGVSVYLSFSDNGSFDIYQKLQEGRYKHFSGTWEMNKNTLYGYYEDGTTWGGGSYDVEFVSSQLDSPLKMTLTAGNGSGEVTTYERGKIPSDVKNSAE